MISFARGAPAPECLPVQELAECAKGALERDGVAVLSYGPPAVRSVKCIAPISAVSCRQGV